MTLACITMDFESGVPAPGKCQLCKFVINFSVTTESDTEIWRVRAREGMNRLKSQLEGINVTDTGGDTARRARARAGRTVHAVARFLASKN